MSEVKIYIVGSADTVQAIQVELEKTQLIRVTGSTNYIGNVLEDIDVNEVDFDKLIVLPNTFREITELQEALNDLFVVLTTDPSREHCEFKLIVKEERFKKAFDNVIRDRSERFSCLLLGQGEKLKMSVLRNICLNKINIEEHNNEVAQQNPPEQEEYEEYDEEDSQESQESEDTETEHDETEEQLNIPQAESEESRKIPVEEKKEKKSIFGKRRQSEDTVQESPKEEQALREEKPSIFSQRPKFKIEGSQKEKPPKQDKQKRDVRKPRFADEDESNNEDEGLLGRRKIALSPNTRHQQLTQLPAHSIIAITGDRGSGVSSTVANLAHMAYVVNKMSVCVVCLDTVFRGVNHYYTKFQNDCASKKGVGEGLVEAAENPASFDAFASKISPDYYVLSLGFDYKMRSDDKLIPVTKVLNLLGYLKGIVNLVIVDIPLRYFKHYMNALMLVDRIGLCYSNNTRSIVNTILALEEIFPNPTDFNYDAFKSKARIVMTELNDASKYRRKVYTIEQALQNFNVLAERYGFVQEFAGAVPVIKGFDVQLDDAPLICESNQDAQEAYQAILDGLLR